ncbi:hypothetical protein [Spirilliplanes yamanashiensis]|uniref:Lipoprotein n=1 Tax=Spirilliplanes yamanashiensis TaxID=42233 RepID=A0A8J4DLE6_9ACTN|nr:hypothetical protein [Spirilliplanes yamanashiensis]MDP9816760.1 hypothetical protein [Spirilliplanes yamanashiensis]GIJ06282.1 hypothetical protein Sya03_56340 [Spirilliplanes yamanashiensis]
MRSRRSTSLAVAALLLAALAACNGRGGGHLPPQGPLYNGQASFGFTFSCQDRGGPNPPTGQLRTQLSYNDHGANPIGGPFGIHGTADALDSVTESMLCIGRNPPPGGNELIFLGRYRATTPAPAGYPEECQARGRLAAPHCRFEVIVRDNDGDHVPSPGDFFSITLSSDTTVASTLDPATVFYTRAGVLAGGNITVK